MESSLLTPGRYHVASAVGLCNLFGPRGVATSCSLPMSLPRGEWGGIIFSFTSQALPRGVAM
eukprot:4775325-Pyramimonas_sp.AAC.1